MLRGSLDIPLMTLLSQTIEFAGMDASSLWSRAVRPLRRRERRGGHASTAWCGEAQSGCARSGMTVLEA